MGIFDIFRRKKTLRETVHTVTIDSSQVNEVIRRLGRIDSTDYLGKAAVVGRKAAAAVKSGRYDEAWKHYHTQKELYVKHGNSSEFTPAQIVALDGSVNEQLANIRRLEKKHDDALVQFIYSYATSNRVTKSQEKKLPAYVNRAKLQKATMAEVEAFIQTSSARDLRAIQLRVAAWHPTNEED